MDQLLQTIGLTMGDFTTLAVLAAVLLIGLFLLRILFKITATLLRVGCFLILFILFAAFILMILT